MTSSNNITASKEEQDKHVKEDHVSRSPNGDPGSQPIIIDRSSVYSRRTHKKKEDKKGDRLTAWLHQDQPFHGLESVARAGSTSAPGHGGRESPSETAMKAEKGSDRASKN